MMNSDLLPYYERELLALRKLSGEFAQRYPERAAALQLAQAGCDDPHVERLLEGFALIAGRIQRKLDDEFPEVAQALIEMLYPHLLRPVPSMGILQFEVDPELSKRSTGHLIPKGTTVYSAPVGGVQCRFRTSSDTRLWPLEVASAAFLRTASVPGGLAGEDARYVVHLEIQTRGGVSFDSLEFHELRFRLGGEAQGACWMYELLFNDVTRVLLRWKNRAGELETHPLRADVIKPAGFSRNEAILPYAETSFQGYRLLQEYFCYPEKFLFFKLEAFDEISKRVSGTSMEILFLLRRFERSERELLLEAAVNAETFQLGCVPAVNLFSHHSAEPIRLSHTKIEYPIVPDVHAAAGMEVYSVDHVRSASTDSAEVREYRPFYSFRHGQEQGAEEAFWFATRRNADRSEMAGTEVYLSFVDPSFRTAQQAKEAVTVEVTCTNRDLPGKLRLRGGWNELDLESGAAVRVRVVGSLTQPGRQPLLGDWQWRLISHLSLNHLSLVEGGANALREILRLYDAVSSPSTGRQIDGVLDVRSARRMARVESEHGFVFVQGTTIDLQLDEDRFAGGSAYLFGCVLDQFFGLYCGLNTFTQLRVSTRQREGIVWQWPLRSGEQAVI